MLCKFKLSLITATVLLVSSFFVGVCSCSMTWTYTDWRYNCASSDAALVFGSDPVCDSMVADLDGTYWRWNNLAVGDGNQLTYLIFSGESCNVTVTSLYTDSDIVVADVLDASDSSSVTFTLGGYSLPYVQTVEGKITNINVDVYDSGILAYSLTGDGATTTTINIPSGQDPYYLEINGVKKSEGDGWSVSGDTVTVTDTLGSTHSYELGFYVSGGSVSEGFTDPLFTYVLEGDFIGFIFACYTTTIGSLFYGLCILFLSSVVYLRMRSLFLVSLIWIFVGSLYIALFKDFSWVSGVFTILGIAGILVEFVFVWRHKQ